MEKIPHTLCIFKNDRQKVFHIWQTAQEKVMQNVNIVNAFSKAKYAVSGKDSAQPGATTSFYRVLLSTKKEDWDVDYVELDKVNREELQQNYDLYSDLLAEEGFRCLTRDPKVRLQSGRYAGSKFKSRKITNMTYVQIKKYASDMLKDCFVDDEVVMIESNRVANSVLKIDSEVDNISQMWKFVFFKYSEEAKDV